MNGGSVQPTADPITQQLQRLSGIVTSGRSPDQILEATVELIPSLFNCETGSLIIRRGDQLIFKVPLGARDVARTLKTIEIPVDRPSFAGTVLQSGHPIIVNQVQGDPRFNPDADKQTGFRTDNLMAVPVIVDGVVIGILEAINRPNGFANEDLIHLTQFASFVGLALQNAQRFDQILEL